MTFLRISEEAAKWFGYFPGPGQEAAHDPGLSARCPICDKPITIEDCRSITIMHADSELCCFYRVHKSCHEALSPEQQQAIEHRLMDLLPVRG